MNQIYWKLLTDLAIKLLYLCKDEHESIPLCTRNELLAYIMKCVERIGVASFAFHLGEVTASICDDTNTCDIADAVTQLIQDLGLQEEFNK